MGFCARLLRFCRDPYCLLNSVLYLLGVRRRTGNYCSTGCAVKVTGVSQVFLFEVGVLGLFLVKE